MSLIDPHASWAALERAAAAYGPGPAEQAIAALVREVRDHMACEIQGDLKASWPHLRRNRCTTSGGTVIPFCSKVVLPLKGSTAT